MKKRVHFVIIILFASHSIMAQSFNEDKRAFHNFLMRMYSSKPFEGVRVVEDYEQKYFISVVALERAKYTSESVMNRVAQVKSRQQANAFFNGSSISSDLIIRTTETKSGDSLVTNTSTEEVIREQTSGFVEGLEELTRFDSQDALKTVFIFMRELQSNNR
jgi:hypothetical protein